MLYISWKQFCIVGKLQNKFGKPQEKYKTFLNPYTTPPQFVGNWFKLLFWKEKNAIED